MIVRQCTVSVVETVSDVGMIRYVGSMVVRCFIFYTRLVNDKPTEFLGIFQNDGLESFQLCLKVDLT